LLNSIHPSRRLLSDELFLEGGAAITLPLDRVELDEENPLYVAGEIELELELELTG
jgi:hypothetical protein